MGRMMFVGVLVVGTLGLLLTMLVDDVNLEEYVKTEPEEVPASNNPVHNISKRKRTSDDFTNDTVPNEPPEEDAAEEWHQLPNGNWKCRHKCGDKTKYIISRRYHWIYD